MPFEPEIAPSSGHKRCIMCREEILQNAYICKTCKSYQNKRAHYLLLIASTASAIALIGSAFTYIMSNIHETRKFLPWKDDINIIELQSSPSDTNISIHNTSGEKIFIKYVKILWRENAVLEPIQKNIDDMEIYEYKKDSKNYAFKDSKYSFNKGTKEENDKIIDLVYNNFHDENKCDEEIFFNSKSSVANELMNRDNSKNVTYARDEVKITIKYIVSSSGDEKSKDLDGSVFFRKRDSLPCRDAKNTTK